MDNRMNEALRSFKQNKYSDALSILQNLEKEYRVSLQFEELRECLRNKALVLFHLEKYAEALSLLKEEEKICRTNNDKYNLCVCLENHFQVSGKDNLDMISSVMPGMGDVSALTESENIYKQLGANAPPHTIYRTTLKTKWTCDGLK
jgi:tetratricopeptide (TPR) repeat protein